MKLQGKDIYLGTLEREDCKRIWNENEYDFENPSDELHLGLSVEKADDWFNDIQKLQGDKNIRLGIFLNDGTIIGDVALQNIDWKNRNCSIGMGISKVANRSNGYGQQAVMLILHHGFFHKGIERITASTLEINLGAQKSLEKCGFVLEGKERKAVYHNGTKYDNYCYSILKNEYLTK